MQRGLHLQGDSAPVLASLNFGVSMTKKLSFKSYGKSGVGFRKKGEMTGVSIGNRNIMFF